MGDEVAEPGKGAVVVAPLKRNPRHPHRRLRVVGLDPQDRRILLLGLVRPACLEQGLGQLEAGGDVRRLRQEGGAELGFGGAEVAFFLGYRGKVVVVARREAARACRDHPVARLGLGIKPVCLVKARKVPHVVGTMAAGFGARARPLQRLVERLRKVSVAG